MKKQLLWVILILALGITFNLYRWFSDSFRSSNVVFRRDQIVKTFENQCIPFKYSGSWEYKQGPAVPGADLSLDFYDVLDPNTILMSFTVYSKNGTESSAFIKQEFFSSKDSKMELYRNNKGAVIYFAEPDSFIFPRSLCDYIFKFDFTKVGDTYKNKILNSIPNW